MTERTWEQRALEAERVIADTVEELRSLRAEVGRLRSAGPSRDNGYDYSHSKGCLRRTACVAVGCQMIEPSCMFEGCEIAHAGEYPLCPEHLSRFIDYANGKGAPADTVPIATYNGLQRALEEANEMVCRFHMPFGWEKFQARWGLRSAAEVLAGKPIAPSVACLCSPTTSAPCACRTEGARQEREAAVTWIRYTAAVSAPHRNILNLLAADFESGEHRRR